MFENVEQKIIPVLIEKEMKKSYIDYAMSVIVGRALPDVRDGLKPVHRRILYTMYESGLTPDKAYRKCADTVGSVLGRYHPHGDAAVYDSLVRMAQDFSLRYPLVDGHGNFGSVDGDSPAAYRYTEARMTRLSTQMLSDIEKETVNFTPNYDERLKEPTVLPSRFPNLLVNGSSGIAVGMATNIPPHNLTEVIDGIIATIDDPMLSIEGLNDIIKGPDFPTGATIMGYKGIRDAYTTGRGRIIIRSNAEIEPFKDNRQRIIVTEIPYMVNKARLIEKIADLVKDKVVDGISDLRDESDRDGMRIVIELKRDANANIVLNQLYKHSQLQESFSVNMLSLVNNQPQTLNLRQMIDYYVDFQKEIIVRRTQFDLEKARARAHILEGLKIALDHIDEVIAIIRNSYDTAKADLMGNFGLTDVQAQAILDMRLGRLAGIEREKIDEEYAALMQTIERLMAILGSESMVLDIIKEELTAIKEKYGDERRTQITANFDEIDMEDLIPEEDIVITMTHYGYVKRLPVDTYKSQKRGGKGIIGLSTRDEDFVENLFVTSTHNYILFFTNMGRVYRLKAYQIPEAGRQAKGTAIVNLLSLAPDEMVTAVIPIREYREGDYLLMATKKGVIKKTALTEFDSTRKGGRIAICLEEGDELIRVKHTDGDQDIIIGTHFGMAIHFHERDVRPMGRTARGVRGIRLKENDYVIGMCIIKENSMLLCVSENGMGKRTAVSEYKLQARGGKGISTYKITEKTGNLAGIKTVTEEDDIMLITSEGTIIRMNVADVSTVGRVTQGVILMRLQSGVKVVSVASLPHEDEEAQEDSDLEQADGDKAENTPEDGEN